jgi:hypothetical protein
MHTKNEPGDLTCQTCGKPSNPQYFCDEDGGPFCPTCWPAVDCLARHGEGCETMMIDTNEQK